MADQTVVHMGENSPEQVAYKLMQDIMKAEKMTDNPVSSERGSSKLADRQYLLAVYLDCLKVVKLGHLPSAK